jgi:anaerobic dimethyl sulfoxide reductase subunit A
MKKTIDSAAMKRRSFLGWSAAFGSAALGKVTFGKARRTGPASSLGPALEESAAGVRMVRTGCPSHNCGGRCLLKVYIYEGKIVRIEGDDRTDDSLENPQLRPCIRGRAYRQRQYHPDRLLYPRKRIGRRGEGKFVRISWDEALDMIAGELERIRKRTATRPSSSPTARAVTASSTDPRRRAD